MSFTQKLIDVSIGMSSGNFQGGGNAAQISGLRVSATIDVNGGEGTSGNAQIAIFGLPLSLMNQLSTVGTQLNQQDKNSISVMAGDAETGMHLVFTGLIHNAYVDAANMPQVCFRVFATPAGGYWAVKPTQPTSKSGPQPVAQMLQQLAQQMGLQFENNGVNTKLTNPYYPGSAWTQATRMARHANIEMVVDRGTMAIMPAGQPRQGGAVLISPQTGMVAYPGFREAAVVVKTLFNPAVKVNGLIQVQSDITPACGTWKVFHMVYELESKMPHGRWFQTIEANLVGQQPS